MGCLFIIHTQGIYARKSKNKHGNPRRRIKLKRLKTGQDRKEKLNGTERKEQSNMKKIKKQRKGKKKIY